MKSMNTAKRSLRVECDDDDDLHIDLDTRVLKISVAELSALTLLRK